MHSRRRTSFVSTSVTVIMFSVLSIVVAVVPVFFLLWFSFILPALLPVIVVLPLALGAASTPTISLDTVVWPTAAGVVVAANPFVPVVASS